MIRGEDVVVVRRTIDGRDAMGEPIFTESTETVANVLSAPSTTDEMDETNRAFGIVCERTFHFPKSYTASLEGCSVRWGGREWRIVGDPQRYIPENTPTPWNCAAKAVRADG